MEKKLQFKDYMYVGSMLFGLFFGAGNLIFPVHMGQEAGANVGLANLGFLVTGIGLPFLGVIAIGVSQSSGVFELASRINRRYAMIFTILLLLSDWAFLCLPRLATTSRWDRSPRFIRYANLVIGLVFCPIFLVLLGGFT